MANNTRRHISLYSLVGYSECYTQLINAIDTNWDDMKWCLPCPENTNTSLSTLVMWPVDDGITVFWVVCGHVSGFMLWRLQSHLYSTLHPSHLCSHINQCFYIQCTLPTSWPQCLLESLTIDNTHISSLQQNNVPVPISSSLFRPLNHEHSATANHRRGWYVLIDEDCHTEINHTIIYAIEYPNHCARMCIIGRSRLHKDCCYHEGDSSHD